MTRSYAAAARELAWLLHPVEHYLETRRDNDIVHYDDLYGMVSGRRATHDELAAVLFALEDLHIIARSGRAWEVVAGGLERTADYRRGIVDALAATAQPRIEPDAHLVAALPASVGEVIREAVERNARDLRAAVVDLIASAQSHLVLASPFWDQETADDLYALLGRRTAAGVRIELLGRTVGGPTSAGLALADLAGRLAPDCSARGWSRSAPLDPLGSETFHFKVAVADRGARAYLGTANFTVSGLRSRMELGIVTRGHLARSIAEIVDAVLGQ